MGFIVFLHIATLYCSLHGLAEVELIMVVLVSAAIGGIIFPLQIEDRGILSPRDSKLVLKLIFSWLRQFAITEVHVLQLHQVIKSIANPIERLVENTSLHVDGLQRLSNLTIAQNDLRKSFGNRLTSF